MSDENFKAALIKSRILNEENVEHPKLIKLQEIIDEEAKKNPSMKVKVFQKDLKIIQRFASDLHCPTPLFSDTVQVYLGAMAMGFENKDTASVCAVLEEWAQLKRDKRKRCK